LVATLDSAPIWDGGEFRNQSKGATWLQVRADRVGDLPPPWLRDRFPGRLLYTLKGAAGNPVGPPRAERLCRAAAGHDLIELDCEQDLRPEVLAQVPPGRRLISWHGPAGDRASLAGALRRLTAVPARYYQLVVTAQQVRDGLAPLELLRACGRRDVIAFADDSISPRIHFTIQTSLCPGVESSPAWLRIELHLSERPLDHVRSHLP
jgi:3-dehydroquinate dehydratase/shikimate dehydrogenase